MNSVEPKAKRRRLDRPTETSMSSSRFRPSEPREWTVSVAVPTSIITSCVTREQRTIIAGQIARALAVFSVDEVVIFDDSPVDSRPPGQENPESYTGESDPAHFLYHILTYLETPPFMRKTLFPLHPNLKSKGLLPSLDMPHHPHKDEWLPYREGMSIEGKPETSKGTLVEIGIGNPITIKEEIPPRTRLTLHMSQNSETPEPVHPSAPRTDAGYFWGFSVRQCGSLADVFTSSQYEEGYDMSIGTSERGTPLNVAFPPGKIADFSHLLVVFGGPRGLEYAAMNDSELRGMGISGGRTKELFDQWVNVLPHQGSRHIRTEEAMFIAFTGLRRLWDLT